MRLAPWFAGTLLAALTAVRAQDTSRYLYAVNINNVTTLAIDPIGGALAKLSQIGLYTDTESSQPAAFTPGGEFVYICEGDYKQVEAFRVNPASGGLSKVPGEPFHTAQGAVSAAVDSTGRFLYLGETQGIAAYTIDANLGAITPAGPGASTEALALAAHPNAPYLFSSTGNAVSVWSIDPGSGALTLLKTVSIPKVYNLEASPDGARLYVHAAAQGQPNTSELLVFDFDAATGGLTLVAGSPFRLHPSAVGPFAIDPTGRFLYVGDSTGAIFGGVAGFLLDAVTGGVLTAVPGSPFPAGNSPQGVAVEQSARFLYVGNISVGNISGYAIDAASGALSPLSGSPFADGGAWQLFAVTPPGAPTPVLISLAVSPANVAVGSSGFGHTVQFTAAGQYSDGSTRFLTASSAWSSSDPSVAKISSNPQQAGLASTTGAGTATIAASFDGFTATATLTVTQPELVSITVKPANGTIAAGTALQFKAMGTFSDQSTQNLTDVAQWVSSQPAVAAIDSTGEATGLTAGSSIISASVGTVSGSTLLKVR
ncbi:MAG TPA: beta-propeller fold lactonase family protein [Bryobacteraceae bacterium]|nr:beta-propeller fold lactonase family protein [Bryobacteraceae bacterium]